MSTQMAAHVEALKREPSRSMFFFGDYGGGKTHLAVAQYRALVDLGSEAMFFTMADLLRELRRAELDEDYLCIVRDRIRNRSPFHLFVDDVDKFKITDFKFEVLYDLFNTLYSRNLKLTVTSNYSLTELVRFEKLDSAIVRRIDEMCQACSVSVGTLELSE